MLPLHLEPGQPGANTRILAVEQLQHPGVVRHVLDQVLAQGGGDVPFTQPVLSASPRALGQNQIMVRRRLQSRNL